MSMLAEWDSLRREARRLEASLEEKVQAYSNLAHSSNSDILYDSESPADTAAQNALAQDIDSLLSMLSDCNGRMGTCVSKGARTADAALLQRYREILFDYTTEFKNTAASIQRRKESRELFSNRSTSGLGRGGEPETEQLLRERTAINSSIRSATGVLGQGLEMRESLRAQSALMHESNSTLSNMSQQFPGINRVVDAIRRRKFRENMIVGSVIAGCICFVLWWFLS